MKNQITLILALLIGTTQLTAQLFTTKTSQYEHKGKMVDTYLITLDIDKEDAKEYWNDFMEDENDTDIKGFGLFNKKDLLETELMVMRSISNDALKLFVKFEDINGTTHIQSFLKKKDGTFVSSSNSEDQLTFTNFKRLANRYLEYFIPLYYQQRIKNAEENLEDANDMVEDINDNIEDNKKDISKNKEKVIKLKEEIQELNAENEDLKQELKENEKKKVTAELNKAKAQKIIERKKFSYKEMIEMLNALEPK